MILNEYLCRRAYKPEHPLFWINLSRLTTRSMNVNTGHETLSQSDHYTSIQPIRGITRNSMQKWKLQEKTY
ncbi:hypothetical protein AIG32_17070 [Salmonella enterica subsp. enterica]|nr:hypothetical protein [Salmonella enterica subsp. enterica]